MILPAWLGILISVASGFAIVDWLWPGPRAWPDRLVIVGVGTGIGITIGSWGHLLGQALWPQGTLAVILIDLLLLAGGVACWLANRRRAITAPKGHLPTWKLSWPAVAAAVMCLIVLIWAVPAVFSFVRNLPHGLDDAWAIWNLKARFLYRGGPSWGAMFAEEIAWSHPDYPLLLPLTISRLYHYAGSESPVIGQMVALLFAALTIGMLGAMLWQQNDAVQAFVGIMVLAATPALLFHTAWQYADVPLAFFILTATGLTTRALAKTTVNDHPRPPYHLQTSGLVLAGMVASCAAWTKNEGLLFVVALVVAVSLVSAVSVDLRTAARRGGAVLLGAAGGVALIVLVKSQLAPTQDPIGATHFSQLLDIERHGKTITLLATRVLLDGMMDGVFCALLATYVLVAGWRRDHLGPAAVAALTAVIIVAVYYVIYVASSNMTWLVETTASRLLLHVWPTLIFAGLLAARSPAQMLFRPSTGKKTRKPKAAPAP